MSYKVGDYVRIIEMQGEPRYAGREGRIELIDGIGQLHGTWGGCALIPQEDSFIVIDKPAEYKYGMRSRGFSPLCQPMNGFIRREDSTKYYDVIVYNRELTEKELRDYQLDKVD